MTATKGAQSPMLYSCPVHGDFLDKCELCEVFRVASLATGRDFVILNGRDLHLLGSWALKALKCDCGRCHQ